MGPRAPGGPDIDWEKSEAIAALMRSMPGTLGDAVMSEELVRTSTRVVPARGFGGVAGGVRRGSAWKGCLIAVVVMLLIALGIGVFVAMSWRGWVSGVIRSASVQAISESSLPQDQKDRLTVRMTGLTDQFKDGTLTFEQIAGIMESLQQSPLLPLAMVYGSGEAHIGPSALTTEEKAAATRSLARFTRGVLEEKIPATAIDDVLVSVTTRGPNGQLQAANTVTIEQLRSFIAAAKAQADDAKVPDEDFQIDIAAEVDKVIDRGLQKR